MAVISLADGSKRAAKGPSGGDYRALYLVVGCLPIIAPKLTRESGTFSDVQAHPWPYNYPTLPPEPSR